MMKYLCFNIWPTYHSEEYQTPHIKYLHLTSVPRYFASSSPILTWCVFLALPHGMSMSITDRILLYPKCKNAAQNNNLLYRWRQRICHTPPPPVKLIPSEWGCTPVFMSTMVAQNKHKSVLMIIIMKQLKLWTQMWIHPVHFIQSTDYFSQHL